MIKLIPQSRKGAVWYCVQVREEGERNFHEEAFESKQARTNWLANCAEYIGRVYEVQR